MNLNYLYNSGVEMEEIEKDVKKFFDAYTIQYLGQMKDFSDYSVVKRHLEKTRDEYSHLTQTIKKSVEKILSTLDKNVKDIKEVSDFSNDYPIYVSNQDPTDAIEFFDMIDKEDKGDKGFNYTKAANLLGISRGTLYNWLETSSNGFVKRNKKLITKEELYRYYLSTLKKKNSSNPLPPHLKKKK
jgi:DNA-binding protein Fis